MHCGCPIKAFLTSHNAQTALYLLKQHQAQIQRRINNIISGIFIITQTTTFFDTALWKSILRASGQNYTSCSMAISDHRDVIVCVVCISSTNNNQKPSWLMHAQASPVPFDTHVKLIQVIAIAIVTGGVTELITSTLRLGLKSRAQEK